MRTDLIKSYPDIVPATKKIDLRTTDGLTRSQFRSVRGLLTDLTPDTAVYPTHGFGSFCSSTPGSEETLEAFIDGWIQRFRF